MDKTFLGSLSNLPLLITAVGGVGTTAFGLVDSLKAIPGGGLSRVGFAFIRKAVLQVAPPDPGLDATCLSVESLLLTLQAHWINGVDTQAQIQTAKSLIRLRLNVATAPAVAQATGLDAAILAQVVTNLNEGTPLTEEQQELSTRLDLILGSLFDEAYQRGDQRYRNIAKFSAIPMAVGLAVALSLVLPIPITFLEAIMIGVVATPIAPVAKDLSSMISDFKIGGS